MSYYRRRTPLYEWLDDFWEIVRRGLIVVTSILMILMGIGYLLFAIVWPIYIAAESEQWWLLVNFLWTIPLLLILIALGVQFGKWMDNKW